MNTGTWKSLGGLGRSGPGALLRATALLAVLALLIGACGGGDDDNGETESEPTATSEATTGGATGAAEATSTTASEGATGSTGTQATGATGGTGQTGAGGVPTDIAALTSLESFRWNVSFSGAGAFMAQEGIPLPDEGDDEFTASGAYIAPDQAQLEVEIGGERFGQVIKGDQQWLLIGGTAQGPIPATEDASSIVLIADLVDVQSVMGEADLDCDGTEEVNGVSAIRCNASEAADQELVDSFGVEGATLDDATFNVWIAEEGGFVVRWQLQATGTLDGEPFEWDFEADITDVNEVDSIEDPS